MAQQFLVTIPDDDDTTAIDRVEVRAPDGAYSSELTFVGDNLHPTPDELTEIIGRAAELAFESVESPAQVADLAIRIQTRLVGKVEGAGA